MRKALLALALLTATVAGAQLKKAPAPAAPAPGAAQANPIQIPGATPQTPVDFTRIRLADAEKLYRADKAVFIDVRSNEAFTMGHIKGALSIPGSQIIARFREIPPGKVIVTYCACSAEQSSGHAVRELNAHGVKNVAALEGGWNHWKAAGLPIAAGPK